MAVSHVQLHQYPQQCTTQTQRAGPVRLQLHSGVGEGQSRGQDRTGQHAKGMLSLLQGPLPCKNYRQIPHSPVDDGRVVGMKVHQALQDLPGKALNYADAEARLCARCPLSHVAAQ